MGPSRNSRFCSLASVVTIGPSGGRMYVRNGMTDAVVTVGPSHTLREAARLMAQRMVGAAVVNDPEQPGPGIITERDLLLSIGANQDPDSEIVGDHLSANLT